MGLRDRRAVVLISVVDNALRQQRLSPSSRTESAVAAFFVDDCEHDQPRVAMPRAETQLVVRFGPSARGGLDVAALGARQRAHRKVIRAGQRTVIARLRLGATESVLGVPASSLFDRIVWLEDLWGPVATRRLIDQLGNAPAAEVTAVFERAIAERLQLADDRPSSPVVLAAAERLESANVSTVADDLEVSERSLRRAFHHAVGMSPKAFAKLARFHRAVRAAREDVHAGWANIAAAAGYYDQAHLISDFRELAGVTPRALLHELQNVG